VPARFQVDTSFYDHPKVLGLSDGAIALWVRAGSYSASVGLDGSVPAVALRHLSDSPSLAAELVRHGLWHPVGAGGYKFSTDDHPRVLGKFARVGARPWIPTWLRGAVYERDGFRCVKCGSGDQLSLDHVKHWSKGGQDTLDNLRTYCLPCNWARGARA
jgi:HNH endonuclease